MNALTLHQPWASLIGLKLLENRSWRPPWVAVGRPLAIHAGKTIDYGAVHVLQSKGVSFDPQDLPSGALVSVSVLLGSIDEEPAPEDPQSRWWVGPYAWVLDGVKKLPKPIPCRGRQGIWKVPEDIHAEVVRQLDEDPEKWTRGKATERKPHVYW